jgi:hypothetical protein
MLIDASQLLREINGLMKLWKNAWIQLKVGQFIEVG